jgi:hypothetical protein
VKFKVLFLDGPRAQDIFVVNLGLIFSSKYIHVYHVYGRYIELVFMGVLNQQKNKRALHICILYIYISLSLKFHIPILSSLNKGTNITRAP